MYGYGVLYNDDDSSEMIHQNENQTMKSSKDVNSAEVVTGLVERSSCNDIEV